MSQPVRYAGSECVRNGAVRVVEWVSRACDCQEMEREQRRLAARIPRAAYCSLDNYVTVRSKTHTSQREARRTCWFAR